MDRTDILGKEPVPRALRKLGMPAIMGMVVTAVYNLVDTYFIGMLNDTASLGAATVLFPVFMLISAVGLTFGMGAASVISRRLGERMPEEANRVGSTSFFTALGVGFVFAILGLTFIEPLLAIFGATPSIMEKAVTYGSIIIGGSIFQILNMCMNNMLRSEGSSKISGIGMSLGAILNIIFDPIFMFALDMGLAGAAVATILGQALSTMFLFSFYLRKKTAVRLSLRYFHPRRALYAQIMAIGIPTMLRQGLSSLAMAFLNNAAAPFGDSAIAAVGINQRVIMLPFMILFGYSQGFQPLAGYAYGAGDMNRVKEALRHAVFWTSRFAFVMALVLFGGAPYIVGAFSKDPEVLSRGVLIMRLAVLPLPFMGFQLTFSFFYQALGRARETLFLAVARQGLFFIPLVLALPRFFGLTGLYMAQPAADMLTVALTAVAAIRVKGLLVK